MHKNVTLLLDSITNTSSKIQTVRLKEFSKFNIELRNEVFRKMREEYFKIKNLSNDKVLLNHAAMIIAIDKVKSSCDEITLNTMNIKSKFSTRSIKREKLIEKWAIIKRLKTQENMSYRDIQKYIRKHHRIDVAHSTIFEVWHEFEEIR